MAMPENSPPACNPAISHQQHRTVTMKPARGAPGALVTYPWVPYLGQTPRNLEAYPSPQQKASGK